jgi:hypothetical protein
MKRYDSYNDLSITDLVSLMDYANRKADHFIGYEGDDSETRERYIIASVEAYIVANACQDKLNQIITELNASVPPSEDNKTE